MAQAYNEQTRRYIAEYRRRWAESFAEYNANGDSFRPRCDMRRAARHYADWRGWIEFSESREYQWYV